MAGPDNSLWFKINEDKGGEVVYFKRRNGKLWKLGDGTFGVVYVVHSDLRGNDFAVKLLYDNESTTSASLSRLPSEAVAAITERVLEEEQWPAERARKLLEIVLGNYRQSRTRWRCAARADLSGWESILEKIRKRANSAAVERFNRESRGVRHHPRRSTEPRRLTPRSAAPSTSSAALSDFSRTPPMNS